MAGRPGALTLAAYIAKRFAHSLLVTTAGVFLLYFVIELERHMSRFRDADFGLAASVGITLLKMPGSLYGVLPLIVAVSALAMSVRLATTSEFIAVRSFGVSGMAVLAVPAILAALLGLVSILVLNPVVAATERSYRNLSAALPTDASPVIREVDDKLWLKEDVGEGTAFIRIAGISDAPVRFFDFDMYVLDREGAPLRRHHAEEARLVGGNWALYDVKSWDISRDVENPELSATHESLLRIPTALTEEQIRENLNRPEEIAIWDLDAHIERLENAGFSTSKHRVHFHTEVGKPVLLAAMALLGAIFTLRPSRFAHVGQMAIVAVLASLAIYFVQDFARVLGQNGQLPAPAAAWIPAAAALSLSLGLLIYLEEER